MPSTRSHRTWWAGGLLAAALTVLLAAWFASGWSDVRARQTAARARPVAAGTARAEQLAAQVRARLDETIAREIARPYFQYQNLYRDPRASASIAVMPSPLAGSPPDPIVRGYFQIDGHGVVTTPTLNDDVPALSWNLTASATFRDAVSSSLGETLRPPQHPVLVAQRDVEPSELRKTPIKSKQQAVKHVADVAQETLEAPPQVAQQVAIQEPQTQQLSRNLYSQNRASNQIYLENTPSPDVLDAGPETATDGEKPTEATVSDKNVDATKTNADVPANDVAFKSVEAKKGNVEKVEKKKAKPASEQVQNAPNDTVTIVVSPLELSTRRIGGEPELVATRTVDLPDEVIRQGFVIDRAAVPRWIANASDAAFEQKDPAKPGITAAVQGDWVVRVTASSTAMAAASLEADAIAKNFLLRFVGAAFISTLAAAAVLMLVSRSEKLAQERSQFAAAAAHELRTPLAGLQLYGDMLADGLGDPDKQRDYAKRMAEEAARLGRVVSNVLGFSQLERGNLSVDARTGDVSEELRAIVERVTPTLERAGAKLEVSIDDDLRAKFDRDALARIVANLLDNAEKYGRGADDRTIVVRATGPGAEITVEDRGSGVSEKARDKLFEAFARGVNADGPAGLGLGLALSRSLARAMGGELVFRPRDGGGAIFVVRLAT
ncbi:MAG TPA: HAMP domain-containing sensor histidine kinase [Kofleriaceae bacterium]|jgi:signal transduction histidine kinase